MPLWFVFIFKFRDMTLSTQYQVDGRYTRLFGTSAAAPVVGAILTMVNDARITVGKKPIGFINPAVRFATPIHYFLT